MLGEAVDPTHNNMIDITEEIQDTNSNVSDSEGHNQLSENSQNSLINENFVRWTPFLESFYVPVENYVSLLKTKPNRLRNLPFGVAQTPMVQVVISTKFSHLRLKLDNIFTMFRVPVCDA